MVHDKDVGRSLREVQRLSIDVEQEDRGLTNTDEFPVLESVPTAKGYHSDDSAEMWKERSRASRYTYEKNLIFDEEKRKQRNETIIATREEDKYANISKEKLSPRKKNKPQGRSVKQDDCDNFSCEDSGDAPTSSYHSLLSTHSSSTGKIRFRSKAAHKKNPKVRGQSGAYKKTAIEKIQRIVDPSSRKMGNHRQVSIFQGDSASSSSGKGSIKKKNAMSPEMENTNIKIDTSHRTSLEQAIQPQDKSQSFSSTSSAQSSKKNNEQKKSVLNKRLLGRDRKKREKAQSPDSPRADLGAKSKQGVESEKSDASALPHKDSDDSPSLGANVSHKSDTRLERKRHPVEEQHQILNDSMNAHHERPNEVEDEVDDADESFDLESQDSDDMTPVENANAREGTFWGDTGGGNTIATFFSRRQQEAVSALSSIIEKFADIGVNDPVTFLDWKLSASKGVVWAGGPAESRDVQNTSPVAAQQTAARGTLPEKERGATEQNVPPAFKSAGLTSLKESTTTSNERFDVKVADGTNSKASALMHTEKGSAHAENHPLTTPPILDSLVDDALFDEENVIGSEEHIPAMVDLEDAREEKNQHSPSPKHVAGREREDSRNVKDDFLNSVVADDQRDSVPCDIRIEPQARKPNLVESDKISISTIEIPMPLPDESALFVEDEFSVSLLGLEKPCDQLKPEMELRPEKRTWRSKKLLGKIMGRATKPSSQ